MELSLTKLPWYAQVGAFVALAIGACGAFVYLYEMPTRADMASRQSNMRLNLSKAQEAVNARDVARAQRYRDAVEADIEALERFLGR